MDGVDDKFLTVISTVR